MEKKRKIIINIVVCMSLLIVTSLYIVKENIKNEWFDEKELYSFASEISYIELEHKGYICISNIFDEIPYNLKFFIEAIEKGKNCYIKVYTQNEQNIVAHIFYYRRELDCIREISYDISEERATILEYSSNIQKKRNRNIDYIILTPLENGFLENDFLLCQYKNEEIK